jgi:hypothetical protein
MAHMRQCERTHPIVLLPPPPLGVDYPVPVSGANYRDELGSALMGTGVFQCNPRPDWGDGKTPVITVPAS